MVHLRVRKKQGGSGVVRRVMRSLGPAALGAAGGYYFATMTLGSSLLESRQMVATYAAMGAAVALFSMRLGSVFLLMYRDYTGKS